MDSDLKKNQILTVRRYLTTAFFFCLSIFKGKYIQEQEAKLKF